MEKDDIKNRFVYHSSNESQTQKYENIRKNFMWLAELINELCPDSREKSLSITNLEQAQFWANASIARNEKQE